MLKLGHLILINSSHKYRFVCSYFLSRANMAKLVLVYVLLFLGLLAQTYAATTYTVGDNSGWDISTNLDSWTQDKKFVVGDLLLFQYTSSESVNEVTKESYDNCSTTAVINSYTNGNTTVTLSRPGAWYFISGNKLYCLGGMKLAVNVEGNQAADQAPAGAPQAAEPGATLPRPSSKNNNPVLTSAAFLSTGREMDSLIKTILGLVTVILWWLG
ncbi:blue copper protein [Mercurialis annua]|uniref:blue copper protein n=1 Tax=Mercurialis annua TaxID=3986 RepID=UPI00215F9110|nr:blue copper protein [Mercurialis annua]